MAQLRQRVFMILIRPCFVKAGPGAGYPNVVTKYIGKLYRAPIGSETKPTITGGTAGYTACIELPSLNASVLTSGASDVIGGGIERFHDNTGKGRMPANRPTQTIIDGQKDVVEQKNIAYENAKLELEADPENESLISAMDIAKKALEAAMHELNVMITGASTYSKPPFNANQWFSDDYWALHSTWTSFDECKNYIRLLIDLLGFESVMVANYVELDMELLPNK